MSDWLLAMDTSAYTTSLAAVGTDGRVLDQKRRLLPVALGERGLRQSEACFMHIKQLPQLFSSLERPANAPLAVAVSSKPRQLDASYMPVFLVGTQFATVLAAAWGCPLYEFSHQEGHIMAGLGSAGGPQDAEFLALHLSGGTTELLRISRGMASFRESLLGGSADLHIGQFVDRVGVALGLPFPAGPHLEILARQSAAVAEEIVLPSYCKGMMLSFSGAETRALSYIQQGKAIEDIARAVERCIAKALEKLLLQAAAVTGLDSVLLVGGVAANGFVRSRLQHRLGRSMNLYFAVPELASDNAVGIGWLGLEKFHAGGNYGTPRHQSQ